MARTRSVLFHAVQSILKYRYKLTAIFLALLTFFLTLLPPVVGTEINALKLEQQGQEYYNTGEFALAAKFWQLAADAYGEKSDGRNRNLINQAKALQSLGLDGEACSQVLKTFAIFESTCEQFIKNNNKFIQKLETLNDLQNRIIGLRLLGEILQRLGELDLSQRVLEISLRASNEYPESKSAVLLSLGNIERAKGNKKRDELDYEEILNTIVTKSNAALTLCNSVSDRNSTTQTPLFQTLQLYNHACDRYQSAANLQVSPITQIQAKLNQLSLLVSMKNWWSEQIDIRVQANNYQFNNFNWLKLEESFDNKIEKIIPQIELDLNNLPKNRESVYAQINFANSLIRFGLDPQQKIAKILSTAIEQARKLKDKQAEATALSNLARLYELQVSSAEKLTDQDQIYLNLAKNLTEQALNLSDDINIDNRQLLYRQRRQLGRILKAQGNVQDALFSYAEAWNILQSLRGDLVSSVDNQFSFRQNVEPVYREFIDLLLRSPNSQANLNKLVLQNNITGAYNQSDKNTLEDPLDIARLVMESLQLAELDNFFQEPCDPPVAKPVEIANIDKNAAVIYPIILKDRLEVIISRQGQKPHHYPTAIASSDVMETIEDLANIIYNQTQIEPNSALNIQLTTDDSEESDQKPVLDCDPQKVWREELDKRSALKCNQIKIREFEQKLYDWLIRPLEKDIDPNQVKTLVFVLDRPFQRIPIAALDDGKNYLVSKYNLVLNLGQQLIEPKPLDVDNLKIIAAGVSSGGKARGKYFSPLKNVEVELAEIDKLGIPIKKLLDPEFTKNTLQEQIKFAANVVHLATHGVFSSNREQTFILTGDNNSIGIDDFQNLLNPKDGIRSKAIELLVLSACQTALGDSRAALGIAGVALRSGAKSTVAALWPVSDAATAKFMKEFYQNLINRDRPVSRAEALRQAQLSLLNDPDYNHPFYWAPFILVGNWL